MEDTDDGRRSVHSTANLRSKTLQYTLEFIAGKIIMFIIKLTLLKIAYFPGVYRKFLTPDVLDVLIVVAVENYRVLRGLEFHVRSINYMKGLCL